MEDIKRYRHLNEYFKNKFGERTLKICIDGNFTCPNRDGLKGYKGCIFCSERGSGDHIHVCNNQNKIDLICDSIKEQVENYFKSYKAQRANKFIAYFQNFTNTYDTALNLKRKYDASLIDERIVALAIATRPDCLDEEKVKLIKSYSEKYYVWVDLGFQTANEKTGEIINRKYSNKDFENAIKLLNKYNIDVVVHLMVGLPGEGFEDIKNTVKYLNKFDIQGIKIHSTYVVKNTKLAEMYLNKEYKELELDDYLNSVVYIITHINPKIIIHRFSGDAPKDLLLAPSWNSHKKWVLNGVNKILHEQNLYQGMYYKEENDEN